MRPTDIQLGTYFEYGVKHNDKDPYSMLVIM